MNLLDILYLVHKQVYLKKPGAKGAALLQLSDYQEDKGGGVLVLEDMQEAFGPGSYTISADGKTHTLEFEHGCSNTRFMPNTFAAALTVCVGPDPEAERERQRADKPPLNYTASVAAAAQSARDAQGGPVFRYFRTASAQGLAPPLMHPVFGQFKENIEDAAPATGRDFRFAQHFCTEAVHFYPLESRWVGQQLLTPDRPDILVPMLFGYCGLTKYNPVTKAHDISTAKIWAGSHYSHIDTEPFDSINGYTADNFVGDRGGWSRQWFAVIIQVEDELGCTKTEQALQMAAYHDQLCIHNQDSQLWLQTCCPCFGVYIAGPYLQVFALARFHRKTHISPLTDLILCSWEEDERRQQLLARTFASLRTGITDLIKWSEGMLQWEHRQAQNPALLNLKGGAPWPLWLTPDGKPSSRFMDLARWPQGRQMFSATDTSDNSRVMIKFTTRYGEAMHRACLSVDPPIAPGLREVQPLPGGWYMVVMDRMGPEWKTLDQYDGKPWASSVMAAAKETQRLFHSLTVTEGPLVGGSVMGMQQAAAEGEAAAGQVAPGIQQHAAQAQPHPSGTQQEAAELPQVGQEGLVGAAKAEKRTHAEAHSMEEQRSGKRARGLLEEGQLTASGAGGNMEQVTPGVQQHAAQTQPDATGTQLPVPAQVPLATAHMQHSEAGVRHGATPGTAHWKICHGDARKLNLAAAMVDKTPDGKPVDLGSLEWEPHQVYPERFQVKILDFDWAGRHGVDRYPYNMNPRIPWPDTADVGQLLLQEHDAQLLTCEKRATKAHEEPYWHWSTDAFDNALSHHWQEQGLRFSARG